MAAGLTALALLVTPAIASAVDATLTTVAVPAGQLVHGQTAKLTATVANTTTPATVPTGSVQFYLDQTPQGAPIALSPTGTAELVTAALSAGSYPVRAMYLPATGFSASESATMGLTVNRATTTTVLRITPATTGVAGQDLAVEADVKPTTAPLGAPSGQVSFSVAGQKFADDTLDPDGISRGSVRIPAMSLTITVLYAGDAHYAGSAGSTTVSVSKGGTVIALSASPNPAPINQPVTFTMSVDSLAPSMWWPSGLLSAAVDGQPVAGSVPLDGSSAGGGSFTSSFSTAGVHRVVAHFTGDEDFTPSDAALDLTVLGPALPVSRRVAARGLSVKVAPKRDRSAPYRFAVSGSLQLPSSVAKSAGCSGKVTVEAKLKNKRVARKTATVSSACRFSSAITLPRKGTASITASFAGNARIAALTARAVKVRAG